MPRAFRGIRPLDHLPVKVDQFTREGGSESPCKWVSRPGIYKGLQKTDFRFSNCAIRRFNMGLSDLNFNDLLT